MESPKNDYPSDRVLDSQSPSPYHGGMRHLTRRQLAGKVSRPDTIRGRFALELARSGVTPTRVLKAITVAAYSSPESVPDWNQKLSALNTLARILRLDDPRVEGGPQQVVARQINILIQNPTARSDLSRLARMLAANGSPSDGAAEVLDV